MAEDSFEQDSFKGDGNKDSFVEDSFVADEPEKKKSESQSNSDSGTLESTDSPSPYAPQSISKKSNNPSDIILSKASEDFNKNPIFQESNPNYKKNREVYINHLASKGYDKKALHDIAEGVDAQTKFKQTLDNPWGALQPYANFANNFVQGASEGVNAGLEKFNKGLGTLVNAVSGQTGGVVDKAKELTKGGLEVTTGLGETGLSAAAVVVPEMAAFVGGSQAVKETANATLPENEAKYVNDVVDFPFAAVSKTAQQLGFNPEKHENWAMLMQIADFAAIAKGAQVYGEKTNPIQSAKDLTALSDKAVKGELTPEETKKFQEFADKTKEDVSIDDIKKVAEEKGATGLVDKIDEKLNVIKEEREKRGLPIETYADDLPQSILTTIDRIDRGIPVDMTQLDESSKILYDKYNLLKEEKSNPNRIQTVEEINSMQEKIGEDITAIEDYKNKMRESEVPLNVLNKKIEDLSSELNNENISPETKAKFQDDINATQLQLDELTAKRNEVISGVLDNEVNDAKTEALLESKKNDLANAQTPAAKELINSEIDALKVAQKEQKLNQASNRRKKIDYTEGKRAEDKAVESNMSFSSPEEFTRYVIENSENPAELATEYLNTEVVKEMSHKAKFIEDYGIKMTDEEFNRNYDKNKKNFTLAKKYIDNKRPIPLDVQLMELSERAGVEITEKDLFDHIDKMEYDRATGKESDVRMKFKSKFKDLTGKELTPSLAREIVKDEINKNIDKYEQHITRENLTAEAEEQLYYEGIKNGTIPTFDSERYGNVPRDKKGASGKEKEVVSKKSVSEDVKSIFDKAMDLEKRINEETDMKAIRELKRENAKLRAENPKLSEIMNKFKAITSKLSEDSIIKKSAGCP